MSDKTRNIELDQEVAKSTLEPQLPAWYRNQAITIEKLLERSVDEKTLEDIIDAAFEKIASRFSGYQQRQQQLNMSKRVLTSLYKQKSAVIEAGTGVGKSFAYLVAAVAYSYLSGEKVFIATETKNLQMQLYEKDINFIQSTLQDDLTYELCLGSSNYLCKTRYEDSFARGAFLDTISAEDTQYFHGWAKDVFSNKLQGHQFELKKNLNHSFWQTVNRDSDSCIAVKCPEYSRCNYYRVKKIWQGSRILLGNHHLFLYNILNDKKTLPPFDAVVLDEAHGFIKTGFSIFTQGFGQDSISDRFKNFERFVKNSASLPQEKKEDLLSPWHSLSRYWLSFFSQWEVALDLTFSENYTKTIGRTEKISSEDIYNSAEEISSLINDVLEDEEDATALSQWQGTKKFIEAVLKFSQSFKKLDFQRYVYWAEKKNGVMFLYSCNLQLGEILDENIQESVIFTSATLGYWPRQTPPASAQALIEQGYFGNFINEAVPQSMVSQNRLDKLIEFSTFLYRKNCALYIPKELTIPQFGADESSNSAYIKQLTQEIVNLVDLSHGGALILFTSKSLLEKVHEQLCDLTDLEIYSQLVDGAAPALEKFRNDPHSILLGTNSFWQGVDVAGYGLRLLIITKLMFTPPDDPIFSARSQLMEAKGQKPFFELALPFASQMLRQAFGRLIRSETDKGVVAILDNRLLTKSYGKILLSNLPSVTLCTEFTQISDTATKNKLFLK